MANFTDETKLIPSYVEADFTTTLNKFIDLLRQDDTFKDFNYHGSNIAMITELMSYFADFTNFYTNMVAKNVYSDTANVYETVHRLVTQKGYIPLGWLSSEANISVSLSASTLHVGDQVIIDGWQTINSGENTEDGDAINYTITDRVTAEVTTAGTLDLSGAFRQGTIDTLTYLGHSMVDNQIVLPFRQYDVGMYPYDVPAIQVIVNDEEWTRVHDFYDHISGLTPEDNNVYTFYYDKYERYTLSFTSSMNVPEASDTITIKLLRSLGDDGIVGANTFSTTSQGVDDLVIENITYQELVGGNYETVYYTDTDITAFTNPDASVGGAIPETIVELKANANANMHTQFRNVTAQDYKFHMEMRSDITKAIAWGEQEVDPGNTIEYNKVYVSCIPRSGNTNLFLSGVLNTVNIEWHDTDTATLTASVEVPTYYTTAFTNNLLRYLEPRKMISVYEFPVTPQAVYFRYDIGLRVSRAYKYTDVLRDVRNKLIYYFTTINRSFGEEINFMDMHNSIFDMSIVNGDDYFLNIKGLDNLVIRDQSTYSIVPTPSAATPVQGAALSDYLSGTAYDDYIEDSKLMMGTMTEELSAWSDWTGHYDVFEPNTTSDYPQYTQDAKDSYIDNKLRPIQLGYNQFPLLAIEMSRFYNESA